MLKATLEEGGYKVAEASNGNEGIKSCRQHPCDLVVTDIFMPEKEGLETITELRREFPAIKIIAISGGGYRSRVSGDSGLSTALRSAKDFGADRTLRKPFDIDEFLAMIEELAR